ncbi:putative transmembrane efflux pump (Multidrug resistance related protein) [Frankia canadensis]|uniref:Putative transmembrane efflux pump (Multidrug resistance related protein) n=1 Tax=Frankia canadensis TaxID=1836972 RepID=A0A2I2L0W5_9ACTN|nr:putative transmembrane efflux pump (Multidrug resistance related protein) [Frankia canadensis]SOU58835.1 putative transmembrane efflux pump (Multidrug resistance related protein) [Frankia canadensis]
MDPRAHGSALAGPRAAAWSWPARRHPTRAGTSASARIASPRSARQAGSGTRRLFSVASIGLALTPWRGSAGALWLIAWRVVQGVGGAMLMANSTAILTDAFPTRQRGMALGINQVAARIDWWGNITFAIGLTALLAGVTYGIQPYGGHDMGWTNPKVLGALVGGAAVLAAFLQIERRVGQPMFNLVLFRIRAFSAGNAAVLLSSIARGGMQFMLIIWLQGIWLPLHGYDYVDTPLWAGVYLLPLTIGFLVAGPVSGFLSDRFGARAFATGGLLLVAGSFLGLLLLPMNFSYPAFAALLVLNGVGSGLFSAPNTTAVMNAVPAASRGGASGMRATFMNSGQVLSIGLFFSMMIAGLASSLPSSLRSGLAAHHVPADVTDRVAGLPPVGSLFAAFLGYNRMRNLLGDDTLRGLPPADAQDLTGRQFFPHLIASPFHHGLVIVFTLAIGMSLIAALASLLRGSRYVHVEPAPASARPATTSLTTAGAGATSAAVTAGPTPAGSAAVSSAPAADAATAATAGGNQRAGLD